ncbi:MAG: DUF6130 family protein [Actinomycetota bacterium]
MKRRIFSLPLALILTLVAAACGGGADKADPTPSASEASATPTVAITSPKDGEAVKGNVVDLVLSSENFKLVKADGDVSGKTGHYHVFLDKEPVPAGTVIPKEKGITHSAESPVKLTGLTVGDHTIKVVLGDGEHKRIGTAEAVVKINVQGPSVQATVLCADGQPCPASPAEFVEGQEGQLKIDVQGVTIVGAADDKGTDGTTGHLHVLVDQDLPAAGAAIPPASTGPDNKVFHTTSLLFKLQSPDKPGLAPGKHTLWVVVGDKAHIPFSPLVAAKVEINITKAPSPSAVPAATGAPAATVSP